jgi:LuxR family quorum sensing-dependent transcriptional regulator
MSPDTFAVVERLVSATSLAASVDALEDALAGFNLDHYAFLDLPDSRRRYSDFVFCSRTPAGWLEAYTEANYSQISPALRMAQHSRKPFLWREVRYDIEREPRIVGYLQLMADFKLDNGFVIPVPRIAGRAGLVVFCGAAAELNTGSIPILHMIALLAFEHIRLFQSPAYERCSTLTEREREVLHWVAAGKTAWEIGEILRIAKRTVDEHVRTACQKLNAGTRAHAVAIAIRDHLIEIDG